MGHRRLRPSALNEVFTTDYDLPNDIAHDETCASVAMVFWAARMPNLRCDGRYADILELALHNTVLAGLAPVSMLHDERLAAACVCGRVFLQRIGYRRRGASLRRRDGRSGPPGWQPAIVQMLRLSV